ncbi:exocyst complex component 6B [Pocillopora verrucosa]|uniref:exocyst complex component 6B n=1 Tax=Pocillopora verrucosa TaxID=203993 RepID=UPI00333F111F
MGTEPTKSSSHVEHLLAEIESSDGLLGPTLRAVYDGEEHTEFMDKLEDRIRVHDKDIERMCNYHYQGFIESVNELLKVRGEARKLKIKIKEVNESMQESGRELFSKCENLIYCRTTQRNIVSAIEILSLCLPVLEMYAKLKDQMLNRRYYPALKTLEQLEHTYLPRIKRFRFAEIMQESIPVVRKHIKEASMGDLRDFLEKIRKVSVRLGSIAMKQAIQKNNLTLMPGVGLKKKGEDEELDKSAQDLVDFSPVYKCLYIFTVVGERETFDNYYRKQRRKQARLALELSSGSRDGNLEVYRSYFHQIVGFFVVEDIILHTTKGLVTRSTVDDLWEMAANKIAPVLITCTQSAYCEEPSLLLKVKELIVWFCHTLSGFGFNVNKIFDVLLEMRLQYNEILSKDWEAIFKKIFDEDNYTPMLCQDETEYNDILKEFPFDETEVLQHPFPRQLPFSEGVVKIYQEVKHYIRSCLKFNENLNVSQTEIGDSVRKSTNLLLTRTLNGCITSIIRRPTMSIPQLVQMSINTIHLEEACNHLEEYVTAVTRTSSERINVSRVYGLSSFKDMRAEAEQQVYERLNMKIEDFVELANYNWVPVNSRLHASSYLVDLLDYLHTTFLNFTTLPGNVAQTACMSSCKYLATKLREMLLDEEVKQMNSHGLDGFNQDLRKCEEFVNSNPVEGISDGTLQMTFLELRQLVDLLLNADWSTYFAEHGYTTSKYSRVSPQDVARILEKMTDTGKKRILTLKKVDRDRKKLNETILKRLKTLDANTSGASVMS